MRFRFVAAALSALTIVVARPAQAATIGPDAFGYTASDVGIAFVDISATGTRVLDNNDDSAVSVAIGFGFGFYGTSYASAFLSTNGLISFTAANTTFTNQDLTVATTLGDDPTIAVLWDDWVTSDAADALYYETIGVAGSRQFIVQWNVVRPFNVSEEGDATFQAILYEASGNILMNYKDTTAGGGHASGGSATVGIRNTGAPVNGQVLQWSFNTMSDSLRNQSAIEFSTSAVPVPEPASLMLLATGLGVVARRLRRRS